jgi:amino acid adenylation domain-containing protein
LHRRNKHDAWIDTMSTIAGAHRTLDRDRLKHLSVGVRAPYERDSSVVEQFMARALATPDAPAVLAEDGTISYRELDRASSFLARYLESQGAVPGSSVGVAIERSRSLPVAILAILKVGAAYVPLDRANTEERRDFIIRDASVVLVVTDGQSDGDPVPAGTRSIDLVRDATAINSVSDLAYESPASAGSIAYIMYTSGSTGRPKGVAIDHRAILRLVRNTDFVTIATDDVILQFAPPAFDASTFELWAPLLNGAAIAIPPPGPLALRELADALDRYRVTMLWLTAPLFRVIVEIEVERFTGLRTLLTGGDVVSPEHARRFARLAPNCRLINGYGPTENTTFSCCYTVPPEADFESSIPIGRPIANSTAYVVDSAFELAGIGVPGELVVGGDGLARGYVNLPDLTAERFVRDPFSNDPNARLYRTGDRVRWRDDGLLEFLGRFDFQVKIRGFRIELGEIETALEGHPSVFEAIAVVTDRNGEKALHAFVVPRHGLTVGEAELRSHVSSRLPSYMMPHTFAVRSLLPKFTSGKIDRIALEREAKAMIERSEAPVAELPAARRGLRLGPNKTVHAVQSAWREVLGVSDIELDVNFFDAGGDSLLLLALQKRLRDRFAVPVGLVDLFQNSTIRKQAALLEAALR